MTALSVDRSLGWRRTLSIGVLVGGAALLMAGMFAAFGSEELGYDFRATYLPAAETILDGESPYPEPDEGTLEAERGYVYPPVLAFAVVPFALLPIDLAALIAVLGAAAAMLGALALVGVRDVRCYAALLLSAPAWNALETANVSAVLALAVALVWRYREEAWRSGAALGLAISAKLLLWPVLVWTVATRRTRATAWAAFVGAGAMFLAWAAIGFAGLDGYPDLLRRLSEIQAEKSYSFAGIAAALGAGTTVGHVTGLVVGVALLAWCTALARGGDDLRSFTCALAAGLAMTPIVWQHYLVLLFVPLGIARPWFSPVWLLPLLAWISPRAGHGDGLEPFVPVVVAVGLVAVVLRARKEPAPLPSGSPA